MELALNGGQTIPQPNSLNFCEILRRQLTVSPNRLAYWAVIGGEYFQADVLPAVPDHMRKPPPPRPRTIYYTGLSSTPRGFAAPQAFFGSFFYPKERTPFPSPYLAPQTPYILCMGLFWKGLTFGAGGVEVWGSATGGRCI